MTSPLLVNTHINNNNNNNNKLNGRWQPSINTSTIQEEDSLHRQGVIYEDSDEQGSIIEVDNEDEISDNEDEVDEEDEEEEEEEEEMQDDDSDTYTSSPSIPDENIDFSLVYTLHTFEATVEGQASVTKGDSLTLLDDSNSYWWLVKVLKTNEVGYIPAENIETPFERLARLNKHRNVEVTSVQQAAHFIESDDDKKKALLTKKDKRVTMSKGIYYQSYIILLGEDNEEVEETYEEYEDDMIDEDSQSATIASGDENNLDDDLDEDENNDMNEANGNNQNDEGDEESTSQGVSIDDEVQALNITTPIKSTTGAIISSTNNNSNKDNKLDDKITTKSPDKTANMTAPSFSQSDKNNTTSITPNSNNNNNKSNISNTIASPVSSVGSPTSSKDDKDYKKQSSFLKLFSRGKKQDGKKNVSQNDTSDQGSTNSSTISDDLQHLKDANVNSQTSSTSSPSIVDPSATVLRVYAGNINVNATYNSVLVYDNTNAENLLRLSMDRFHISQIEGNSRGKRSASPYQLNSHNSGVEYYLSVKPMDGDERVLLPQDKPLVIYRSLTAHLTTPMPSLANIKQQIKNVEFGRIGSPTNTSNKKPNAKYGEESIRFYLHKRIRRVNEQNGQVYVKVSLFQDDNDINKKRNSNKSNNSKEGIKRYSSSTSSLSSKNKNDNSNHLSSSFSMRRKKSVLSASSSTSSLATTQSQIDKLIAVPAITTVTELIDIALEKFHLAQSSMESQQSRYRMTIVINNQGTEKHLNPHSKIVEVLHDDTHPESTSEKRFVLRKINIASTKSNARPNNHLNNKNTPKLSSPKPKNKSEINRGSASSPLLTPIPVMQLDGETEMVLRRLERALLTYNRKPTDGVPPRVHLDPQQPKLAVMRNVNKGIDVYLPHGILRSKPLSPQQTQFVLMANDEKNKDSNWNLVTQRVLITETSSSAPTSPSNSTTLPVNNINNSFHGIELISDSDLKELIKFGTKFLESVEQNGALLNKNTTSSLLLEKSTPNTSSSLSSLDELERELHRIIASHTTK